MPCRKASSRSDPPAPARDATYAPPRYATYTPPDDGLSETTERAKQLPFPEARREDLIDELDRRMEGVQRHRLLQGFPMAPMMSTGGDVAGGMGRPWREPPLPPRPLLLGVLPHTFCVPAVKGCGFCTFPHQTLSQRRMLPLANAIAGEIRRSDHELEPTTIPAVYLGGGTANLTPLPALEIILDALGTFRPEGAEITLEGVPAYFTAEQLELLRGGGYGRVRISMGVQTFDPSWIARMGRQHIGAPGQVETAVALAGKHGVGTSLDLLINLPGQSREAMVADVERAIALGVDQVCLYHLVLRADFPVPWASDPEMMAALPSNATAFDHWRAARAVLLDAGFSQATLTNFEAPGLAPDERFRYEALSFRPHRCDALGFGPGAISGTGFGTGLEPHKWINQSDAANYLGAAMVRGMVERVYVYEPFEDALMQLTRGLALIEVPLCEGTLARQQHVFEPELEVLEERGLLTRSATKLALTETGMFYADSVAGLLAWRTVVHRHATGLNEPAYMG